MGQINPWASRRRNLVWGVGLLIKHTCIKFLTEHIRGSLRFAQISVIDVRAIYDC